MTTPPTTPETEVLEALERLRIAMLTDESRATTASSDDVRTLIADHARLAARVAELENGDAKFWLDRIALGNQLTYDADVRAEAAEADRDKLSGEVDRLGRDIETFTAEEGAARILYDDERSKRIAAEAKFAALAEAVGKYAREDGATLLTLDGVNFGTALRAALSASSTVPVEEMK